MALHFTHWAFKKPALGWNRYRDTNPVPTRPLANDIATAPLGLGVERFTVYRIHEMYLRITITCGINIDKNIYQIY